MRKLADAQTVAILTFLAVVPLALLFACSGAGAGTTVAAVGQVAGPQPPPARVVVDSTAKPLSPERLHGVDEEMSLARLVSRLGPPHRETGSGLCIFVWLVADGREFWVGTSHCDPAKRPIYAKFRESAP